MRIRKHILAALFLAGALTASCAVTNEEDANYSYDRVMKAWINVNYPGLKPFGDTGVYLLEMEEGSGPGMTDSSYIKAHYTKRSLDGTITSTNVRRIAEQLGSYKNTNYYGGNFWRLDQGYLPDGLESVLKTMRSGGRVKLALPHSASSHDYSFYSAFSSTSESDNEIIDLTIDTVVTDIYDYQEKTIRAWFQSHYASTDTLTEGLYFKKLVEKTADTDTVSEGASVKVRYIGRLLDGTVFDTNIEDTAKFYRIWNSSNAYSALSINYYKSDESKFSSDNGVVDGFGKAILGMNYGETAVAVFNSTLGYEDKGKSPSVPEYSPLFFWLQIEEKD